MIRSSGPESRGRCTTKTPRGLMIPSRFVHQLTVAILDGNTEITTVTVLLCASAAAGVGAGPVVGVGAGAGCARSADDALSQAAATSATSEQTMARRGIFNFHLRRLWLRAYPRRRAADRAG